MGGKGDERGSHGDESHLLPPSTLPLVQSFKVCCMSASVVLSTFAVASSRARMGASCSNALRHHILQY